MQSSLSQEQIQELAKEMIAGDRKSYAELYDHFAEPIYRFIVKRVGNRADAEDLMATVFMKVWDKKHTYKPDKANFKAWLYRVAANSIVDFFRKFKPEYQLEYNLVDDSLEQDPAHSAEQSILRDKMETVLSSMKSDDASIISWRFFDDLSIEEVADRLGKKEGAVRVQQFRALKKFKKLCEKKGIEL